MAVKYWYRPNNGNSNWNTSGSWFLGPGGTGGATTTPGAGDDAIVNAASGSGTLTVTAGVNINSLNLSGFTGTFAGGSSIVINTTSVASNNSIVLQLGGNLTYTGLITFNTTVPSATSSLFIMCNGLFHKGGMTFNTTVNSWEGYNPNTLTYDPIRLTGAFSLTSGGVTSNELYAGSISASNSNVRSFSFDNVYLSGTGTLITLSVQTNLSWTISQGLYLTSTVSTNKSLSLTGIVYAPNIYLQGSGTATTTIASTSTIGMFPNIFVSKTGGTLTLNASSITSLEFIEGTTIAWDSAAQLTIYGNLILCNSMSVTSSNSLLFAGGVLGYTLQGLYTFNKTFTGPLRVDDSLNYATDLYVYGNYISTTGSTNPQAIALTSGNNIYFFDNVTLNTGISVNGQIEGSVLLAYFYGTITTATVLNISYSSVVISNANFSGNITLNSGYLEFNAGSTINTFSLQSSSTVTNKQLMLNNSIINLNGTGDVWDMGGIVQGVTSFDAGTSTINVTDTTGASLIFDGGSGYYYNINLKRGVLASNYPVITFSGDNTFRNFKDLTTLTAPYYHSIIFSSNSVTYIYDTFQVGNTGNQTQLISSSLVSNFYIEKLNKGLAICPNVLVQRSNSWPPTTFYAISGSSDGGNNQWWTFNTPPRRLSSLGAG